MTVKVFVRTLRTDGELTEKKKGLNLLKQTKSLRKVLSEKVAAFAASRHDKISIVYQNDDKKICIEFK